LLITAYAWIRNNPFILAEILQQIPLSGIALSKALTSQIEWNVKVSLKTTKMKLVRLRKYQE
jgi:hypothetical protein